MFPERFNNKTNGVTARRWLLLANPALAGCIEAIGGTWITDLGALGRLRPLADDQGFRDAVHRAKREAKARFAEWVRSAAGVNAMPTTCVRPFTCLAVIASVWCLAAPALAQDQPQKDGVLGAIAKSLTGDVYVEPSKWRELSLSSFFTEGWDEAWVSPPPGGGGAPRQGWLNSFDGVF